MTKTNQIQVIGYYASHREARLEYCRRYRLEHLDERRAKARLYYSTHRKERWEYAQKYRAAHREQILQERRNWAKEWREKLRIEILSHYSQGRLKCRRCGFADLRALCIDHANGDGWSQRKQIKPERFYKWLKDNNFPNDYQVLCHNCNWLKKIENGEDVRHGKILKT